MKNNAQRLLLGLGIQQNCRAEHRNALHVLLVADTNGRHQLAKGLEQRLMLAKQLRLRQRSVYVVQCERV